ncbi:hypothetical protein F5B21DRAFT_365654 [Xylaria acuta]|nr:hypothetical protein F5B21DRAFT_365654 [Xylaria acuta]
MNDLWEYNIDNAFATEVFNHIDVSEISPRYKTASLCWRCQSLEMYSSAFIIDENISSFRETSQKCDLCSLFHDCIDRRGNTGDIIVLFKRSGSGLQMNGSSQYTLSLCRNKKRYMGLDCPSLFLGVEMLYAGHNPTLTTFQIGFLILPAP